MERHYVEQGMEFFQQGRFYKHLLLMLANVFVCLLIYFTKSSSTAIILIALLVISANSCWVIYYRVLDSLTESKLKTHVTSFDKNITNFFSFFSSNIPNGDTLEEIEIISLIEKVNFFSILKHVNFVYSEHSRVDSLDKVYLSTDISAHEKISIYAKILELSVLRYIETKNYIPENFSKVSLYKNCKDIVSQVLVKQNNFENSK